MICLVSYRDRLIVDTNALLEYADFLLSGKSSRVAEDSRIVSNREANEYAAPGVCDYLGCSRTLVSPSTDSKQMALTSSQSINQSINMRQLLDTCDGSILVGLHDRAFLMYEQSTLCELHYTTDTPLPPIQAVAIQKKQNDNDNTLYCVVARRDKSLCIYPILQQQKPEKEVTPSLIHKTNKRITCLHCHFPMVLAGDVVGDCTAFSLLTQQQKSKLLLGHTASMLTGVALSSNMLLTCDRDEKIRVSAFPNTCIIQGYLLGHTAFVSSMDVFENTLVSCGGDDTVRLWNLQDCHEVSRIDTPKGSRPTRICLNGNNNNSFAVVIFHAIPTIHVYRVINPDQTLELVHTMESPSQPLAIQFLTNDHLLVLQRDSNYVISYHLSETGLLTRNEQPKSLLSSLHINNMPTSILESDAHGLLTMEKLQETRGPVAWHRVERIEKMKASRSRRKRRKRNKDEEK